MNEYKISLARNYKENTALAGAELEAFINDFKATADNEAMRSAFAASLSIPVLKTIAPQTSVRDIFMVDELPAGALAEYPVDLNDLETATIMPRLGAVPQNLVVGDTLLVPTFEISNSVEWKLTFVRDGRYNIVERALEKLAESFVRAEETQGWNTIRGAITSANTITLADNFLSKNNFNHLITEMKQVNGYEPTVIYCSPRRASDIRGWTTTQVDYLTQREIFQAGGLGSVFNVEIRELRTLADNEVFLFDTTRLGVMPIRQKMTTWDDPTAIRRLRAGLIAFEEVGFAVIDPKAIMYSTLAGAAYASIS
jgi:hypothetical protein